MCAPATSTGISAPVRGSDYESHLRPLRPPPQRRPLDLLPLDDQPLLLRRRRLPEEDTVEEGAGVSDAALLILGAILCAAFGGPLWATITLGVLAALVILVAHDRSRI